METAPQLDWYQLDILITFIVDNENEFLNHIDQFGQEPKSFYAELHEVLETQFVNETIKYF